MGYRWALGGIKRDAGARVVYAVGEIFWGDRLLLVQPVIAEALVRCRTGDGVEGYFGKTLGRWNR